MDKWPRWLPGAVIALVLGLFLLSLGQRDQPPTRDRDVSYSEFKALAARGEVSDVTLRGTKIVATLGRGVDRDQDTAQRVMTELPDFGDPDLLPLLEKQEITVNVKSPDETGLGRVLMGLLPWILFLAIYIWFWRRISGNVAGGLGGRGGIGKFLEGQAKVEAKKLPNVTFDDVAGQENAKREVAELVDFLRKPEQYRKLGAEVPHGILLMGPPGTGKTLLARALAGEANVPFFSISASEFIEVFVGVGAARVRNMFTEAKQRAPSIIFIDELDSIGRVRGTGLGGGHDEREQTLNQILAEMDGFSGHEAVIVLAATNRPDVLDPALLRPGRFDRHVTLDLPDLAAREAILKVHTRKVPLAEDIDFSRIAAGTPGFSGADLKNLVNEAAMLASREGSERVTQDQFDQMRDKILMGSERAMAIHPEEHHRLAVHESGHATVAHYLPHADPLYKVTIIPRGRALGATQQLPEEERHTLPEEYLRDRLSVILGGRTAEKLLMGSVSSGADDDIRQATQLARAMVARWGMSDEVGPVDLRQSEEHPFLGREIAQPRHFSETTAHEVDVAIRNLLNEAQERALAVLEQHRSGLQRLVAMLEERETLTREAVEACLEARKNQAAESAQG